MKKSIISAAVVLAFLIPAAAQAQNQAPSQAQGEASVSVTAPRQTYTPGAGEFNDYANTYSLSNGQVAHFTQRGNHYFVQLKNSYRALQREEANGGRPVTTRLRPVGPGAFVTDSGAELTFRDSGDEVTINSFERLPDARVAARQTGVQMIARR